MRDPKKKVETLWVAFFFTVLILFWLATRSLGAQPRGAEPTSDLHGATPMAEQRAALAGLQIPSVPAEAPYQVDLRKWQSSIPADNAMTAERIALGRKLYFDTRLSADNTVACATCHDVQRAFTDLLPTSEGIRGQMGKRNAPTTMNAFLLGSQFWDGRASTVDDQALLPILNPVEMGMPSEEAAVMAISGDAEYRRMFKEAYGRNVNFADIGRAIGTFERTLIFLNAPADEFFAGNPMAIDAAAQRGWVLFNGKARCAGCHPMNASNPLGSDNRFHNVGVSARHQNFEKLAAEALALLAKDASIHSIEQLAVGTDLSELGRFMVTQNYSDIGSFRSPQIRNVGITAPYMHDGSMATLWDVMDHYNKGGEANRYLDGGIEPLALSETEIGDLVAFLFTLTDSRFADKNASELSRQSKISEVARPFRDEPLATRQSFGFDPRHKQETTR